MVENTKCENIPGILLTVIILSMAHECNRIKIQKALYYTLHSQQQPHVVIIESQTQYLSTHIQSVTHTLKL